MYDLPQRPCPVVLRAGAGNTREQPRALLVPADLGNPNWQSNVGYREDSDAPLDNRACSGALG